MAPRILDEKQDRELGLPLNRLGPGFPSRDRSNTDIEQLGQRWLRQTHGFASEAQLIAVASQKRVTMTMPLYSETTSFTETRSRSAPPVTAQRPLSCNAASVAPVSALRMNEWGRTRCPSPQQTSRL
jgi:hypothetical protein